MLSAFTARPIVELRQRDKSRIETIVAHGDRIFVGLNSGALRVYRLNDLSTRYEEALLANGGKSKDVPPQQGEHQSQSPTPQKPTDLLREIERFSTRAIEQLAIIKEANTIVSLSNYHVSLYDLKTYKLLEILGRSKNASCFAVTSNIVRDLETGVPEIISRLAVAVKRRLLLWSWHESELSNEVHEVVLPETVRTITWANATKTVCGMNGGYVIIDAVSHGMEDIVSHGMGGVAGQGSRFGAVGSAGMGYMGLGDYIPKPLAAKLADGELLLAKDINTLFINDRGESLEKRQIPWPMAPESIGYSYPYIVALHAPSRGLLEVRSPDTLSLLQNIALPGAAQLHFPSPSVSLAHAGKGFHISSERCVWKMEATDYDSQIEELVRQENFDEAISILNMLEDALLSNKMESLREVKMQKAEMLFGRKKFRQAMDLMNDDDVRAPPERVLKLFPPEVAGELSGEAQSNAPGEDDEPPTAQANDLGRPTSSDRSSAQPPAHASGTFAKLFKTSPQKGGPSSTVPAATSVQSSGGSGVQPNETPRKTSATRLEGKDLMTAVLELNSYLAGTRARLQRLLDPVTGKLKPAAEKQVLASNGPVEFLRMTPSADEYKMEQQLRETFQLIDTTLFRAYMFAQPSLAGSLFRIPNFCDPEVVNERLIEHNRYTELADFFHGKKLHKEALELLRRFGSATKPDEAAPSLHGPDRTIQYLQNLPPTEIDLILEHVDWTLNINPEYAMEVFTGDTENAEALPRNKVVHFLRQRSADLERLYLEHVVNELHDKTIEFCNRLVELYIQKISDMESGSQRDDLMAAFLTFLRGSGQDYSLMKAFSLIPKDAYFHEAQATVLSNMGQHRQALEIYVFKMKDHIKAEDAQDAKTSSPMLAYDSSQATSQGTPTSVYHTLLSLYLQPPPPHKPQLEPALNLLSKHGSRLPATSTLDLIPDDLPVRALEAYFRGRIRAANSLVNESRIIAKLREAERISVAARLYLGDEGIAGHRGRSRYVTVTEEKHCIVCHKRLGAAVRMGGSVVAVLTDNTIVHYGCLSKVQAKKSDGQQDAAWE